MRYVLIVFRFVSRAMIVLCVVCLCCVFVLLFLFVGCMFRHVFLLCHLFTFVFLCVMCVMCVMIVFLLCVMY